MEKGIITETLFPSQVDSLKDLEDFLLIEKPDEGSLKTLLWDADDLFRHLSVIWIHKPDHFAKGLESRQTEIAGFGKVVTVALQIIEEGDDELR